jgi:predicted nucleotide-binding protein (sugar kinase/HSP70/actin superfamily)
MEAIQATDRHFSSETVGRIRLGHSTFLIPDMNRATTPLLAATLRAFDIDAHILPTYKGLDVGRKFTSGKECFPCLVTLGDLLYFIEEERERLGKAFNAGRYVFFMPETEGPCRFGMYNKFQRIVLDSLPELKALRITAATSTDGYSPEGIFDVEHIRNSRKASYLAMVLGDVMERFIWRVRPYEKAPGQTDALAGQALRRLAGVLEQHGAADPLDRVLRELDEILAEGQAIIDPRVAPKPRIGIVGEIFLRMHQDSNQDLIRVLEKYGAEVVNASMGEWLNYVSYDGLRQARRKLRLGLKLFRSSQVKSAIKEIFSCGITLLYQERIQKKVFKRAQRRIDIAADHLIGQMEKILKQSGVFSFDIPTEACLSIPGIIHCARDGCNGVVNVYPFMCMPSTTTSAVVRPLMHEWRFPYLDAPYDGNCQPNREAAIRTFMYQAEQHLAQHGRGT